MYHGHNLILNTDSYKTSHYLQYPPNTSRVSSYIECRGGQFPQAIFFGLQIFLKEYLSQPITQDNIEEAETFLQQHGLPFNRQGWQHILKTHHGLLPLEISAVSEGSIIPIQNAMLQVHNTDPACYWVTTYIETALLRAIWYPTTVATLSWNCKQIIRRYLEETADSLNDLPYKLHDFGARGVSSQETAMIGGAAHLVNFKGTDTIAGVIAANKYYAEPMAGFSIPAAEHSTITCWGKDEEAQAYANMLKQFCGDQKMVAVVSDSYDLWYALEHIWGEQLKDDVIHNGGTVIVRPDSGNPAQIVTKTIEMLFQKFGYHQNKKGYDILPDFIRVIQGDSVNISTIEECLALMKAKRQSADNIAFGMGGALLQKCNRDTMEFAMKANAVERDGQWQDVFKDPVTGHKKRSKPGRLALIKNAAQTYETIQLEELGKQENLLTPVFRDGKILQQWTFEQIRQRSEHA